MSIENDETEAQASPGEIMSTERMTRAEHLDWCKRRANEYVDIGDNNQAFASMTSDLNKHPETEGHTALGLGMSLLIAGKLGSSSETRKFINGFN